VAVATNFASALESLGPEFESASGHTLSIVAGSTGKLYAQIVRGAPFQVFLAADQERPRRLQEEGFGIPGTCFTYAIGRLALVSNRLDVTGGPTVLRERAVRHVAIANPDLAPYGAAARQTLEGLDLWRPLTGRLVVAQNVGEAFAMVVTGNADAGFVALSSVLATAKASSLSRWDVPAERHAPIRQDAILLARGEGAQGARLLLDFLAGPAAQSRLGALGYAPVTGAARAPR